MPGWNKQLTALRKILVELYPDKEDGKMLVDLAEIPSGAIAFSDKATANWHNILKEANKRGMVRDIVQIATQEYPEREDLTAIYTEAETTAPLTPATDFSEALATEVSDQLTEEIKSLALAMMADGRGRPPRTGNVNANTVNPGSRPRPTPSPRPNAGSLPPNARQEMVSLKAKQERLLAAQAVIEKAPAATDILVPSRKGLEKIVGEDDLIDIFVWLAQAKVQSNTVCKIETASGVRGTGFLLKGGLLMTNNHVIPDAATAENTRLTFNYRVDADRNVLDEITYRLDTSVFVTSHEDTLDYTIVKVAASAEHPLEKWGFVTLEGFFDPNLYEKVTVIQHPKGNYMKMALPDDVISVWKPYLFYETDTREGSSGAPVFNKHWKVIALHHAGKNEQSFEGGLQIDEAGTIAPSNRGILIKEILADLKQRNFPHKI